MLRIEGLVKVATTGKMGFVDGVLMTPQVAAVLLADIPILKLIGAELKDLCAEVNA